MSCLEELLPYVSFKKEWIKDLIIAVEGTEPRERKEKKPCLGLKQERTLF